MLRSIITSAFRASRAVGCAGLQQGTPVAAAAFSSLARIPLLPTNRPTQFHQLTQSVQHLLQPSLVAATLQQPAVRSVTKFSLNKGKRKTVKAVLKRFKRLHWGAWIRTHSGRHKKMFKKSAALKRRLRQHIFTNATQSWLLDKMVTSFWRRPKYYLNDPYAPYHRRDEFFATKGRTIKF